MKALTINRLSVSSLKHRKKTYRLLLAGIVLSIYFVCTLALAVAGVLRATEYNFRQRLGFQDAAIRNAGDITPQLLTQRGLISRAGTISLVARVNDTAMMVGSFDEGARAIQNRQCIQGRLPQIPGEIASERSALVSMRLDAQVGDDITLILTDLGPGKETVKKTFTLTGILAEQTTEQVFQEAFYAAPMEGFPQLVVMDGELPVPLGYVSRTVLVNYAPGVSAKAFENNLREGGYWPDLLSFYDSLSADEGAKELITLFMLLGLSLILTGCVGIANAFHTQMSSRREQIGMMRAVGATRRQIRRIFLREALLIALVTAPPALALSWVSVYILSRAMPQVLFVPWEPWIYLAALAAAVLVVFASALLPAIGGARVSPMQVLRNLPLQRRRSRKGLHSRRVYKVPLLVSTRMAQMYPFRQVGVALLIGLTMFLAAGVTSITNSLINPREVLAGEVGYRLYRDKYVVTYGDIYEKVGSGNGLGALDALDLARLPYVKSVNWGQQEGIQLVLSRTSPYTQALIDLSRYEAPIYTTYNPRSQDAIAPQESLQYKYPELARDLGTTPQVGVKSQIIAVNEEVLEEQATHLVDGRVNMERINRGEEVLILAPTMYLYSGKQFDFVQMSITKQIDGTLLHTLPNDQFKAGDPLTLLQTYVFEHEIEGNQGDMALTQQHHRLANTHIGGVLIMDGYDSLGSSLHLWTDMGTVVTTHQGLAALGLYSDGMKSAAVRLNNLPEGEEENSLARAVEQIALRDHGMRLDNLVERTRVQRASTLRGVIALSGIIMLFTVLVISLMNSNLSSRVRADKRTLGMLRALGADLPTLGKLYRHQLLRMLLPGITLGVIACTWLIWNNDIVYHDTFYLMLVLQAIVLLTMLTATTLHVRQLLIKTAQTSIVDNIREL